MRMERRKFIENESLRINIDQLQDVTNRKEIYSSDFKRKLKWIMS